jgi:hypothetical protein
VYSIRSNARCKGLERQQTMSEVLVMIGFVVAWIVLNRWILPKLGVAT